MAEDDSTNDQQLTPQQGLLLGRGLLVVGVVSILIALGSIKGPAIIFVVVGAGCLWVGTRLSTLASISKKSGTTAERRDRDPVP